MTESVGKSTAVYRFGTFTFDSSTATLRHDGVDLHLQPQPARLLEYLIENRNRIVPRQELKEEIWGDRIVEFDQGLNYSIRQIRNKLKDSAENPSFILTVPRQGYRFVAAVEEVSQSRVALRRFRSTAVVVVAIVLLTFMAGWIATATTASPVLAIVPFETVGVNVDSTYAAGLTDEIVVFLKASPDSRLALLSPVATETLSSQPDPIGAVVRMDAQYLLTGTVRQLETQVVVSIQLINAIDRTSIWAETFVEERSGDLENQRNLARNVGNALLARIPRH